MSQKVFYREKSISYIISIPLGMLILFLLGITVSLLFDPVSNQLVLLPLLLSTILLSFIFYHLYQLKIEVNDRELSLRFGAGHFKKVYSVKDIKLDSFQKETIPWYYGMGWKLGYGGKTIFCAQPGVALSFRLKRSPEKILIATARYQELQNSLIKAQQSLSQENYVN